MKFARMPTFNSLRASSSEELLPQDEGKIHKPFEDISIFTYEEDLPLAEVLNRIHDHLKGESAPDAKTSHAELREFVTSVLPDLDQERVYHSDLKKLCTWYNVLNGFSMLPFGAGSDDDVAEEVEAEADTAEASNEAEQA